MACSAATPAFKQRGANLAYSKMQRRCQKRTPKKGRDFHPERKPSNYVRSPEELPLEADFIKALESLGLECEWEPWRYKLLLGRGRIVWFQPDVWIPELGMYLEITSTRHAKRIRAKEARVAALSRIYSVPVVLVLGDMAREIIAHPRRLYDLLRPLPIAVAA